MTFDVSFIQDNKDQNRLSLLVAEIPSKLKEEILL